MSQAASPSSTSRASTTSSSRPMPSGIGDAAGLLHRGGEDRGVGIVDGAGRIGSPGATISSPVEMTATRGLR